MDIQLAAAEIGAVRGLDADGIAVGRAVIRDEHSRRAVKNSADAAGVFRPIGGADGHAVPNGERGGIDIDRHVPVERDEHQRAVLIHDIIDAVARRGVYLLNPAGDGGAYIAADGITDGAVYLVVERVELVARRGHGEHDGVQIDGREKVALLDLTAAHGLYLLKLHAVGDIESFNIVVAELAGA